MTINAELSLFNLPDLRDRGFAGHNEESSTLWAVFRGRRHDRVPVVDGRALPAGIPGGPVVFL